MADYINRLILTATLSFSLVYGMCQSNHILLTGSVTDKESALPLQGISVYINNTTFSTQTDKDGRFRLSGIALSDFDLIFSAVNYETQTMAVDTRKRIVPFNVKLQKNAALLNEVVITATVDKNGWALYGSTFLKDFLSYSAFAKKCEITNSDKLRFRRIKKDNILKGYSKEPLKIRNHALGYDIIYWLNEYEHQFARQLMFYNGNTQFEEMKGNKRQTATWRKNREQAFRGSLPHFIRAVYENKTSEEGFIVNLIQSIPFRDLPVYVPAFTDTTTVQSLYTLKQFIGSLYRKEDSSAASRQKERATQWLASKRDRMPLTILLTQKEQIRAYYFLKNSVVSDQVFIYRFDLNDSSDIKRVQWETAGTIVPDTKALNRINGLPGVTPFQKGQLTVPLFYSRPLNTDHFVTRSHDNRLLRFKGTWQITYTREPKDKEYIEKHGLQNSDSGYQESTLTMAGPEAVIILPNGYYTGPYSLITGAYWSYEKIDKMLPLDYKP